jgi:ATP-dependent RNA helicase RhlE
MSFTDLDLIEPLQRAVAAQGYSTPTPIQARAIPLLLAGRDVLGCAQTGTGKTAAFSLPILQHLEARKPGGRRRIRVLVMTPTRELAAQIDESFSAYGRFLDLRHCVIFGGVSERPQIDALRKGLDILVATPGRLLDLQGRGLIDLRGVEFFVLDEADRMLDMGFVRDVRRVLKVLPQQRQNLLFSATMPKAIRELADSFLRDPEFVAVTPQATTVERIEQSVMFVAKADKRHLIVELMATESVARAIVFTRTKHGANRLTKVLVKAGIEAAAIHGNKSQGARTRALEGFRKGAIPVLVATDLASRGIDVDDVSHVFNFDLPNEPESYVHRIGRTARAGRGGVAVSFCDPGETEYLYAIERLIGMEVPQRHEHSYHCPEAMPRRSAAQRGGRPGRDGSRGGRDGSRGGRDSSRGGRDGSRASRSGSQGGARGAQPAQKPAGGRGRGAARVASADGPAERRSTSDVRSGDAENERSGGDRRGRGGRRRGRGGRRSPEGAPRNEGRGSTHRSSEGSRRSAAVPSNEGSGLPSFGSRPRRSQGEARRGR